MAVAAIAQNEVAPMPTGENPKYRVAFEEFVKLYNKSQYDSIYARFTPLFTQYLSPEKSLEMFTQLRKESGKIKGFEFGKWANPVAARYNVFFKRDTVVMNVCVDGKGKFMSLMVKSFMDTMPEKPVKKMR